MAAKFESTTQLMKNAFPAGSLQPRKDFCVVEDKDGEHMIFLVDDKTGHLSLVLKGANGQNELIDLSRSFEIPKQNSIRTFAVSQNSDGVIHLVFAVQRPGTWDELYVLRPMAPKYMDWADSSALRSGLYKPMQSASSGSVNLKDGLYVDDHLNVEIDRILLGTSNDYLPLKNKTSKAVGAEALAYPQAYLVVKSPDRLTKDIWTVSINTVTKQWARRVGVTMPVNAHDIIDLAVANLGSKNGRAPRGLFVLYREVSTAQPLQLRFIGINVADNKAYPTLINEQLPVPADACSLSTFENSNGTTDLLIGARHLHWLPADICRNPSDGDQTTSIDIGTDLTTARQTLITQTTATDTGSGISLWTLNSKGLLSYQEFDVRNASEAPAPRTTPIPLITQQGPSQCFAALNNADQGQKLFVVSYDITKQKPVMSFLEQSRQTGLWQSPLEIMMPDSTEMTEFLSYTTMVQVSNSFGVPAIREKVCISCSSSAEILVNGITIRGSSSGTLVATDDTGTLTVIVRTDGLSAPCLTLTALDAGGNSLSSTSHLIDPTAIAWAPFANVKSASDLRQIENQDGSPFVRNGMSDEDLSKTAEALKQLNGIRRELATPSSTVINESVANPQWGLWYWVKQKLKSGFEWFLERVKDGWKFVVKIAGQAWDWLLTNLPQVAEALQQILSVISAGWDSISKLLQKLLGWDEILRVKNVFSNLTTQAILWASDGTASANDKVTEFFQDMRDKVKLFKELKKNLPSQLTARSIQDAANAAESGKSSELQKILKGPDAQFGAYHLKKSTASTAPGLDGSDKALLDRILARFGDVWDEIKQLGNTFSGNLEQVLSKGELTIDAFIDNIGLDLLENVLAVMEKLANALLMALSDILLLLADSLNRPFNIPVLSPMYRELTNGGSLTVLDAVCLVFAIPTTIAFRFITGQNPTEDPAVKQWTQPDMFRVQLDQRMGRMRTDASSTNGASSRTYSVMLEPMTPNDLNKRTASETTNKIVPVKRSSAALASQASQEQELDIHDFTLMLLGQILFDDSKFFKQPGQYLKRLIKGVMECIDIIKVAIPICAMGYWNAVTFPKVSLQIKDPTPALKAAFKAFILHVCKLGTILSDPIKLCFAMRKARQQVANGESVDLKSSIFQDMEPYKEKLRIRLQIWVVGFLPAVGRLGGDYGLFGAQLIASCIQAAFLTRLHVKFIPTDEYSVDRAWEEWFKLIGGASLAVAGLAHLQDYGASIAISFLAMESAYKLELDRMDESVRKINWASLPKRNWDALSQKTKLSVTLSEDILDREPSSI